MIPALQIVLVLLSLAALWVLATFLRCVLARQASDRHELWLLELPSATSYKMRAPKRTDGKPGIGCWHCGHPALKRVHHGTSHTSSAWAPLGPRHGTRMTYWTHLCEGCGAELFRTREPTAQD
jgi:hypothetical protein